MVYLIVCEENGTCKIGVTNSDPKTRLKIFQCGFPYELKLTHWVNGGVEEEKILHKAFNQHRIRGEWFNSHSDILNYFEQNNVAFSADIKKANNKNSGRPKKDFSVKTSKVYLYLPNKVLIDYKSDRIKEIIVGLSDGKYKLINSRVLDVPVTEKEAFFVEPWKDLSPADNESVIKIECSEPKNIIPVKAKFVLESDADDSDYSKNNLDHRGKNCVEWVIALMGDASTDVQVKIDLYKHIEKLYESFSSRDFS